MGSSSAGPEAVPAVFVNPNTSSVERKYTNAPIVATLDPESGSSTSVSALLSALLLALLLAVLLALLLGVVTSIGCPSSLSGASSIQGSISWFEPKKLSMRSLMLAAAAAFKEADVDLAGLLGLLLAGALLGAGSTSLVE